jgi:3-dehydroquinate dehydratase/shikimate dehydrogenase
MIIASVLPESKEELLSIKDQKSLPPYLEIRLDAIGHLDIFGAFRSIPVKMIATCRRKQEGGIFLGNETERILILEKSIESGHFEMVDVEMRTGAIDLMERHKSQKFIVSYHNHEQTPDSIHDVYKELSAIPGGCFYKLVPYAQNVTDNLKIKAILEEAHSNDIPLISFCMGAKGILSRILSLSWGSRAVYSAFSRKKATAPGQMDYREMESTYRSEKIDASARIFAVIGNPLGHTLSPAVHNAAYRSLNLNYVCVPFEIDSPEEVLAHHKDINLAGMAVTSPFKEKVIPYLDGLDEEASTTGAVNTVILRDKKLFGYNTDHRAFLDECKEAASLSGKIVILGDGGAAAAACFAFQREEVDFEIFSRNENKGRILAERFQTHWRPLREINNMDYDLLVNCTTVGMAPLIQDSPIKEEWLKGRVVFDLIYHPPETKLMKMAKERGMDVIGGAGMLLRQAAEQFRLLTGQDAPIEAMRGALQHQLLVLDNDRLE